MCFRNVPAPRIVLLQGSVPLVTMEPFARFLIAMGYPADRLRNPRDGAFSYSSFADSAPLAGELAFDYEQSGMEPMLIGHSQGGMLAIRMLYELAGAFHDALHVVDPATGAALARTSIVDPHTGQPRPVVGLHVAYAAALATGWLPRLMLGQWSMLPRLRRIPDTADEFTGFILPNDPIAGNLLGDSRLRVARPRARAQRRAARHAIITSRCRAPSISPPTRRSARGSMPGRRKAARRRLRATRRTSSMRPTSGTASSATGARRRRDCSLFPAS